MIGGVDYKTSKDKQYLGRAGGSQYDIDWRSPTYGLASMKAPSVPPLMNSKISTGLGCMFRIS